MTPLVSVISVNFNGLELTCELLFSLYFHVKTPFECIVVDNGSCNNEAIEIGRRFPLVKVLRSEKNLGFAGANNLAMMNASGDYFLLLNNDTVVEEDILPPLLMRFSFSQSIGAVGPKVRFFGGDRPIQFAGYTPMSVVTLRNKLIGFDEPDNGQHDIAQRTPAILGAAIMVSRKVMERVGLIHEQYFLYYEELDWCERIKEAGYELWYEPMATVYHKGCMSVGGRDSTIRLYYQTRNRLYYAQRNLQIPMRWASYLFQMGLAIPRKCFTLLIHGKAKLIPSVLLGVYDFVFSRQSFKIS